MSRAALAPLGTLFVVVLLLLTGQALAPGFISVPNVMQMMALSAFLGIVAFGETVVILTGGIDLSVAWVVTGAGVVFTSLAAGTNAHLAPALAAALGVGLVAGLANGVGIARFGISPIVMTLGMNNVVQGFALLYTQGTPTGRAAPAINTIATGRIGEVPVILIFWIVLAILVIAGLRFTSGGRRLYGVGENPLASQICGVRGDRVTIIAYAISGLAAALTGVLFAGFSGASFLGMGDQFLLPSIAAVVLGGTSILGGSGGYAGTIAGALFLTVLSTVLSIGNISAGAREIVNGAVIIAAILLHKLARADDE